MWNSFSLVARWRVSQTSDEITSCLHVCQFVQAIKRHPIMWGCSSPWQCSVSHCEVTETKAFVEFMIKTERVSLHTSMHAHTNTVYKYTVHSLSLSLSFPPSNSTLVNHSPSLKINAALQPKIAFCILYSSTNLVSCSRYLYCYFCKQSSLTELLTTTFTLMLVTLAMKHYFYSPWMLSHVCKVSLEIHHLIIHFH